MVNTRTNTQPNRTAIFAKLKNKYGKWLTNSDIKELIEQRGGTQGNATINESELIQKAWKKAYHKYYNKATNHVMKSITEISNITAPECPCGPAPPLPKLRTAGRVISAIRSGKRQRNN